jgi:hypothetical protein
MVGLVAIVAHDRRTVVDVDDVERLATSYERLRGPASRHRASAGEHARVIGLGLNSESAQEAHAHISSWAFTAGAAHNTLGEQPPRLEDLEGQFAWISYDAEGDAVEVGSDPFGMFPVYVAQHDGKSYIATSALALAKHLHCSPSRIGVEVFLRAGYHFGTLTNWEGLQRLEPGVRIVFARDDRRFETYWRPQMDPAVAGMTFRESVTHCTAVARDTYSQLLTADPGLWTDLSGGFDTRLLALLLREAGVEFRTNTTGDDTSVEVEIARHVAQLGGWEWTQLKLPDNWSEVILTLLPTSVAWSDGHLDALPLAKTLWGHREKSRVHRSLLIGGGGEHYRHFAWQQEFLRAGKSTQVNMDNWLDMRLLHAIDTTIFVRDPTAEVRANLAQRMRDWASPYSSELNTTQLDVMYAYKVTGHFGAYLAAAGAFLQAQLPFYFRPVFAAVCSTSYRHRANHRLMRHMIHSLDPRIASVQTTTGGPAEPWRASNLHRFLPYYGDTARRAVAKVSQKVAGRTLLASTRGGNEKMAVGRAAVLKQLVKEDVLVPARMRTGRLFEPTTLEGLIERAARPDFSRDELIGRIVTLELALQAVDASLDD